MYIGCCRVPGGGYSGGALSQRQHKSTLIGILFSRTFDVHKRVIHLNLNAGAGARGPNIKIRWCCDVINANQFMQQFFLSSHKFPFWTLPDATRLWTALQMQIECVDVENDVAAPDRTILPCLHVDADRILSKKSREKGRGGEEQKTRMCARERVCAARAGCLKKGFYVWKYIKCIRRRRTTTTTKTTT